MDVRITRVSWPVTGTARAPRPAWTIRASHPPGSQVKDGQRAPRRAAACIIEENSRINKHRQPERGRGDARDGEHADDLVGPPDRDTAPRSRPGSPRSTTAMIRPMNVSWSVTGRADADALGQPTRCSRRRCPGRPAPRPTMKLPYWTSIGIVQTVLLAVLLHLRLRSILTRGPNRPGRRARAP